MELIIIVALHRQSADMMDVIDTCTITTLVELTINYMNVILDQMNVISINLGNTIVERTTAGNQTIWIENVTIGFIVMNTILWIHGTDRRRESPNLNQLNKPV
jgi:hypothetical protein